MPVFKELKSILDKYFQVGSLFDTRDLTHYDELKKKIRYYQGTLNEKLKRDLGIHVRGRPVSRAWIKSYEMLETLKLFRNNQGNFKSMHYCEAPGNFIMALHHYLFTKTSVKSFDWHAQTLNPHFKSMANSSKNKKRASSEQLVIGDQYGIIKKFKKQWDYGPDNTGDITNVANIKYYKSKYKDVDFVSGDCGLNWIDEKEQSIKLMYCQLVLFLAVTPKNKTCLIKLKLDLLQYSSILGLLFVFFHRFERVHLIKPTQNQWSSEVYLVANNYHHPCHQADLEILYNSIQSFDKHKSIIDLNTIHRDLSYQLIDIVRHFVKTNSFFVKRSVYYLDYRTKTTPTEFTREMALVQAYIKKKNAEWIEQIGIKRAVKQLQC